ncbi:cytidylyltransferase domain-containing protein [Streptomyces sp. enrichment culture]|uniref:cytidylyltransferase domain-containing protein n=1 Tax=Streptomyces sp. enrichment culture TaxID=1795815 RepID=UPI003F56A8A6
MTAPRTVLAVIPARGGSKGVPGKNLAPVGGVPLVARAVRACLAARRVTHVAVSTDDPDIAAVATGAGADVVHRPAALADDTATSEAALLHALDAHEARHGGPADVVLLVQCTSPFLTPGDVDGVAAEVLDGGADTALTVASTHGFLWHHTLPAPSPAPDRTTPDHTAPHPTTPHTSPDPTSPDPTTPAPTTHGSDPTSPAPVPGLHAEGVNHDKAHRPRRQDRRPEYLETGAAYAMDATGFRTHGHRFFGRTALVPTDPARVLEIDDPHDLARARALAPLLDPPATPTLADVDAVVLDFDGTQTDDRVLIDADGRELVAVHRGDGLGVAALRRAGLHLLILSTEKNAVVAARARKLHVPVLHGIDRKDAALKHWCEEYDIDPQRVLYAGNDVNDLPCMALVGWPVAVADAHAAVRAAARAVTTTRGGAGAVREIAAWLLGPRLDDSARPARTPVPPPCPAPSPQGK